MRLRELTKKHPSLGEEKGRLQMTAPGAEM